MMYRVNDGATQTVADDRVAGRRALRQGPGRLLPPRARRRDGHQAGRRGPRLVHAAGTTPRGRRVQLQGGKESGKPVLIMADENYTGPTPDQDPTGPKYLGYYTDALERHNIALRRLRRRRAGHDVAGLARRAQPLQGGHLVHGRRLRHPPSRPAGRHRHGALQPRRGDRRPRLPQRGRQAALHRQERRRAVAEGYEVRNYGFPEPPEGGEWCSGTKPSSTRTTRPRPTAASRATTTSSSTTWGRTSTCGRPVDRRRGQPAARLGGSGPLGGPDAGTSTQRRRQPGQFRDVPGHEHRSSTRPGSRRSPARVASAAGCGRARRRSTRSPARSTPRPGADDASYKRLHQDVDLTAKTSRLADVQDVATTSSRTTTTCSSRSWSSTAPARRSTTRGRPCPTRTGTRPTTPGSAARRRRRLQLARRPSVPRALPGYLGHDLRPVRDAGDWNGATGSSGGWVDWKADLTPWAGKKIEVHITVATTRPRRARRLDRRRQGRRDGATRTRRPSRAGSISGRRARRPRVPRASRTAGTRPAARSAREESSPRTTPSTRASASRA